MQWRHIDQNGVDLGRQKSQAARRDSMIDGEVNSSALIDPKNDNEPVDGDRTQWGVASLESLAKEVP